MADASALQIIWSGISGLLGAVIGAGATLVANRQNNKQEQAAAFRSRQSEIKDRSFDACVDVLKTGQLLTDEANILWYNPATNESEERNRSHSEKFLEALRNHNAAKALARLAMPPTVKSSFDGYITAVYEIATEIYNYKIESGPTISGDAYRHTPRSEEEYRKLVTDVRAKRDVFANVARMQFNEGAWANEV